MLLDGENVCDVSSIKILDMEDNAAAKVTLFYVRLDRVFFMVLQFWERERNEGSVYLVSDLLEAYGVARD